MLHYVFASVLTALFVLTLLYVRVYLRNQFTDAEAHHRVGIWATIFAVLAQAFSQGEIKALADFGNSTDNLLVIRFFLALVFALVFQAWWGKRHPRQTGERPRPTARYKVVMGMRVPVSARYEDPVVEGNRRYWAYLKTSYVRGQLFRGLVFIGTIGGIWYSALFLPVALIGCIGTIMWPTFAQLMTPHFEKKRGELIAQLIAQGKRSKAAPRDYGVYGRIYGGKWILIACGVAVPGIAVQLIWGESISLRDFAIGVGFLTFASFCTALNTHLGARAADVGDGPETSMVWQQVPACVLLPLLLVAFTEWTPADMFVVHAKTDKIPSDAPVMNLAEVWPQALMVLAVFFVIMAAVWGVLPQRWYLKASQYSEPAITTPWSFVQLPFGAVVDLGFGALFGWEHPHWTYYVSVFILVIAGGISLGAPTARARAIKAYEEAKKAQAAQASGVAGS